MLSEAMKEYRASILKRLDDAEAAIDKNAAILESLELPGCVIRVIERIATAPFVAVRKDVTSMDEAGEILRQLAKAGFHVTRTADPVTGKETVYEDYAELGRREWKLSGNVHLLLFVPAEGAGARCFRKKVGTEIVDKYEIVCAE